MKLNEMGIIRSPYDAVAAEPGLRGGLVGGCAREGGGAEGLDEWGGEEGGEEGVDCHGAGWVVGVDLGVGGWMDCW